MFNNAMMKQAKKMQEKMKIAQEEIAQMETEGSSGGIKVLQSQKIQPYNIINFYSKNFLGRLSFFILAFKSIFFK